MARITAIFLSCVLLTASSLLASNVEETYQAALMQEKGEGNLEEAIRLYQQVIEAHEKGKGDEKMAARAQLRIGVCQEKLGLAQARQTYEAVIDEHPKQPQAQVEAAQRLESTRRREAMIDRPASRTAAEILLPPEAWPPLIVGADSVLINEQMRRLQDAMGRLDSVFVKEQLYGQLQAVQRQMEQVKRQMERLHLGRVSTPRFFGHGSGQQYYDYAYTPPVIPYNYEEVAEVPMQWKFRLEVDGVSPQRHRDYATLDFDDSEWADISIGRAWEDQGYAGYDKGAWYRTTFAVAADSVRPVLMAFGGVDKDAFVYVNGQLVGQHHTWDRPFILDISDHVVRDGENAVALYVYDGANMGGVYGLINVHQPTGSVSIDAIVANRGGHLRTHHIRSGRTHHIRSGRVEDWPLSRELYSSYAYRPPRIPYPHQTVAEVPMQWKFCLDVGGLDPQRHREYAKPDFDDSEWADISIGQAWENQGYAQYDEGAWYRTRIKVDAEKDRPVHLAFGGVDKDAYVHVNGHRVGEHHDWDRPFILDISDHVVRDGENTVAVYVYDGRGMGGVYGLINVHQPIGEENLDRYLANRGGSAKRSFWSLARVLGFF